MKQSPGDSKLMLHHGTCDFSIEASLNSTNTSRQLDEHAHNLLTKKIPCHDHSNTHSNVMIANRNTKITLAHFLMLAQGSTMIYRSIKSSTIIRCLAAASDIAVHH